MDFFWELFTSLSYRWANLKNKITYFFSTACSRLRMSGRLGVALFLTALFSRDSGCFTATWSSRRKPSRFSSMAWMLWKAKHITNTAAKSRPTREAENFIAKWIGFESFGQFVTLAGKIIKLLFSLRKL